MNKKAFLLILDGWGIGDRAKDDVIYNTPTPHWDKLLAAYPHSQLQASGENVGLPDGQMGNSEVGHLNIGAGRVVYQDLVKINRACADKSIFSNPEIVKAFTYARENGKQVHLMGLVSDGGVHSSLDHLFVLCDIASEYGIDKTFVHCFMDGRDTDPRSGKGFIEALEKHLSEKKGAIASIIGRYYAMDRDKRWERVKEAYDLLVNGKGTPATDMVAAMQASYDADITDEFVKPIVHVGVDGKPVSVIEEGDVVIFFNYRNDRGFLQIRFQTLTNQVLRLVLGETTHFQATDNREIDLSFIIHQVLLHGRLRGRTDICQSRIDWSLYRQVEWSRSLRVCRIDRDAQQVFWHDLGVIQRKGLLKIVHCLWVLEVWYVLVRSTTRHQ